MPIASPSCFTAEHIAAHAFDAPLALAEQAVFCLELVAELAHAGLDFQFKGGNSLLVILQKPQRFSIDVDIATGEPRERIESCLDHLVKEYNAFIRWEKRQHKTKPWIPLASYCLYYASSFAAAEPPYIMLDAQLCRSPYATERRTVECSGIFRSDQLAEVPLPASLIGDKLLTLGPSALGIPLGKNKQAQRLKHIFDISTLLQTLPELALIRDSFFACVRHEAEIQSRKVTHEQVRDDTILMCAATAACDEKVSWREPMPAVLQEHLCGIDQFAQHLLTREYSWRQLQIDAARVAFCIAAVCGTAARSEEFGRALTAVTAPPAAALDPACLAANPQARYYWQFAAHWLDRDPFAGLCSK